MGHQHTHTSPNTPLRPGDHAEEIASIMQALATPSRVRILAELQMSPQTVGELAEAVGMEASAVSHQLRILRNLRLVVGERLGRTIRYSLHDTHVGVLLDEAAFHIAHLRMSAQPAAHPETA